MRHKNGICFFCVALLLFILTLSSSHAQQIYVSPYERNTSVGNSFSVDVMVSNVTDLSAFEFGISFNEDVLEAVEGGIVRGALWNDSDYVWSAGGIDNPSGSIGFTSGAASSASDPVSGSTPVGLSVDANGAILATITFQTIAEGTSQVELTNTLMCDVNGNTLNMSTIDGLVTTSPTWNIAISAGWSVGSCPGDPVNGDVSTLINGTSVFAPVYIWNPEIDDYDEVDTILGGASYWFSATEDTQLPIEYQPQAAMTCQIKEGWNMVGGVSGDVPVSSLTSVPAGVVVPYVYSWNPDIQDYELVDTMVAGGGYWVGTISDAAMTMDSTQVPAAPPAQLQRNVVKVTKPSWESVIAIHTQNQRQELTFGMHPSASGSFDMSLDRPSPPSPAWGSALKAGWMVDNPHFPLLTGSYVGDGSHASWELSVELSESGELTWSHLPSDYRCVLEHDGQVLQMQDAGSIYLPSGSHTLTLILDSLASLPRRTQLLANYPNPFNPETWIPYHLSEASDVTIMIYDMSGREVRRFHLQNQLAGEYQDKSHAVYWDGRNHSGEVVSSGVYFYSLQTARASQTRKLVIIR